MGIIHRSGRGCFRTKTCEDEALRVPFGHIFIHSSSCSPHSLFQCVAHISPLAAGPAFLLTFEQRIKSRCAADRSLK
uniref:Ovule protein n=1 Tax=Parascaris univalens TaxID=6257 RepID=A0A915AUT4_PARUN